MMVDPYHLISCTEVETHLRTEGETGLRRGRLVYGGGDFSVEGKISLWMGRLFYGGEDSFLLMVEQNC